MVPSENPSGQVDENADEDSAEPCSETSVEITEEISDESRIDPDANADASDETLFPKLPKAPVENQTELKNILQAAFMSADGALSISRILAMFPKDAQPEKENLENAITGLQQDCEGCGVELRKVGNRYRYYTRDAYAPWLRKLRSTKTPRYSRALLETLSIIAYRQPVSRGDVEDIRGVAVSTDIMRTLVDREWVKQVGYRDVPGRPALYGTTRLFLEYFGLSSLQELPVLMDQRELGDIAKDMNMELPLSLAPVDEQSTGEQVDGADAPQAQTASEVDHDTAQEQAAAEYVRAEKTDDGQSEDHTDIDSEEVPPDTSEQATQIDLSGNESIAEEPVKDSSENQSGREST